MCSVFPIPGFPMVRPGGCGWDVPHVVPAARPQTKSQVGEGKEASPPTGSLKEDTQLRFLVCGPHPSGAETWRSSPKAEQPPAHLSQLTVAERNSTLEDITMVRYVPWSRRKTYHFCLQVPGQSRSCGTIPAGPEAEELEISGEQHNDFHTVYPKSPWGCGFRHGWIPELKRYYQESVSIPSSAFLCVGPTAQPQASVPPSLSAVPAERAHGQVWVMCVSQNQ